MWHAWCQRNIQKMSSKEPEHHDFLSLLSLFSCYFIDTIVIAFYNAHKMSTKCCFDWNKSSRWTKQRSIINVTCRAACSHWLEIIPTTFPLITHTHTHTHTTCSSMCTHSLTHSLSLSLSLSHTHTRTATNSNQNNNIKSTIFSQVLQPTHSLEEGFWDERKEINLTNNGNKLFT